jgi:MycE methyltransferase N-terminal
VTTTTTTGPDVTETIIAMADRDDASRLTWILEFGAARVADAVMAEVAARAALFPGPSRPVPVQLDLGLGDERLGFRLGTGAGRVTVAPGWSADAQVVIRQDLAEMLCAVFGPPGRFAATREITTEEPGSPPGFESDDPALVRHALTVTAARQVIAALEQRHWDLTDLAVRFGTDKWGSHWYTPLYDRYFGPLRDERVKLLEIGVGGYHLPDQGGASLRMWKWYFRRGIIHGLDLYDKRGIDEPRLRTHRGDQGDPAYLGRLANEIGPLDIVIDDGSHINEHVVTSFKALFPRVRPGGLYVIEDVLTAFWPGWGGHDGPQPTSSATSLGMVKALVDGLHHQDWTRPDDAAPSATDLTVTAVHVHHNLVVIEKGRNTEQGVPVWVSRDEDPRTWLITE